MELIQVSRFGHEGQQTGYTHTAPGPHEMQKHAMRATRLLPLSSRPSPSSLPPSPSSSSSRSRPSTRVSQTAGAKSSCVPRPFTAISPLLLLLLLMLPTTPAAQSAANSHPHLHISTTEVCDDFTASSGEGIGETDEEGEEMRHRGNLPWTLEECTDVWTQWVDSIPAGLHIGHPYRAMLQKLTRLESSRAGQKKKCFVKASTPIDGVGSSTIAHMATWMFAREVGCDWVTPEWPDWSPAGVQSLAGRNSGNETAPSSLLYCHGKVRSALINGKKRMMHPTCSVASWVDYFRFGAPAPSVALPTGEVLKEVILKPDHSTVRELEAVIDEAERLGLDNVAWDQLLLGVHPCSSARYTVAASTWDRVKRGVTRDVLRDFKDNFHASPRPWYNPNPECGMDTSKVNIAIHIRLGDRMGLQEVSQDYFLLLEEFMRDVTEAVLRQDVDSPIFHVFTETLQPCPHKQTGLFKELPMWPVEMDQVHPCWDAETPPREEDCPGKYITGGRCPPKNRSGIFRVQQQGHGSEDGIGGGPNIVVHVGDDAATALSCMINQADGILMGCSTFGQLAGVLTRGISMFSASCAGEVTGAQYMLIPPLAIAERGEQWVPVAGSWRDPRLTSMHLFDAALSKHLETKHGRRSL